MKQKCNPDLMYKFLTKRPKVDKTYKINVHLTKPLQFGDRLPILHTAESKQIPEGGQVI